MITAGLCSTQTQALANHTPKKRATTGTEVKKISRGVQTDCQSSAKKSIFANRIVKPHKAKSSRNTVPSKNQSKNKKNIQSIKSLYKNGIYNPNKKVSEEQILKDIKNGIVSKCTVIDLRERPLTNKSTLIALINACPNSTKWHLRSCIEFKDSLYKLLAEKCPKLETVSVVDSSSITSWGTAALAQSKSIKNVRICNCCFVDDAAVAALFKGPAIIQSLDVSGCYLTDRVLKEIAKFNKGLVNLNIDGCLQVTSKGIEALANSESVKKSLKSITMNSKRLCSPAALDSLKNASPGIKIINQ